MFVKFQHLLYQLATIMSRIYYGKNPNRGDFYLEDKLQIPQIAFFPHDILAHYSTARPKNWFTYL